MIKNSMSLSGGKKWTIKRNRVLYLMLVPTTVFLLIFNYYPLYGLVISFQDYYPGKGFFGSPWVGLKWFKQLASMPDSGQILYNTMFIAMMKIIFTNVVSIIFALLLNEIARIKFKRVTQTLVYLPHFLSWVVVGGVFIDLLSGNGLINLFFKQVLNLEAIPFLSSSRLFPYTLIVTDIWKGFGWGAIIFLASLSGIDPLLYEAAIVDGANRWKQTIHITLPGMMATIILVMTLALGRVLNAGFEQVLVLYSPVVYSTGDIIDTYVYRVGLEQFQFSLSTAVGMFKSVVAMALISVSYFLAFKFTDYRIF